MPKKESKGQNLKNSTAEVRLGMYPSFQNMSHSEDMSSY